MVEFKVRYRLVGDIYESRVFAATSGSAMKWVLTVCPGATDISISESVVS